MSIGVSYPSTSSGGGGSSHTPKTDTSAGGGITGAINSTNGTDGNGTFTLSQTPVAGSIKLTFRGLTYTPGVHFNLAGNTITFVAGHKPISSGDGEDNLVATYDY